MAKMLIICDVDGVLTDGTVSFDSEGRQWRRFNVRDGHGVHLARRAGIETIFVSRSSTSDIAERAKWLGVRYLLGVEDKYRVMSMWLVNNPDLQDALKVVISDDVADLPLFKVADIVACPSDAMMHVRLAVDFAEAEEGRVGIRLSKKGGEGAYRELVDHLIDLNVDNRGAGSSAG